LTPYRIVTPEPIATKFSTMDYARAEDPLNQIWYKFFWGILGKWANNVFVPYFIYLGLYLFSETRAQVRPVGFLRAIAQNTLNHAMICLLGVIKLLKFDAKPLFIPENRQKRVLSTENA